MKQPVAAMINILGTHNRLAVMEHAELALSEKNGHLHIYGKVESKIGRKMAHYTLLGNDLDKVYSRAKELTDGIEI